MNPEQLVLAPLRASANDLEAFYQQMRRYSFRLLLRDVIARREGFAEQDVCRYASEAVTKDDLGFLVRSGLLAKRGRKYKLLNSDVDSFGETLEWYVCSVLRKEFCFSPAWSVLLAGEGIKGDYDVLASAEGKLVYVETKSSPPKHIHESQVLEFLARTKHLGPDMAIFRWTRSCDWKTRY